MTSEEKKDCFIIMPISDADGYPNGHFGHVFENIIKPSCELAGYNPVRADQVKETNLIHLDILTKLIEAPMAICDLSNRNPNVLFELGIRQAFDKPVVLIQEKGTPKIFDIAPLRYLEYSNEMKYHDVLSIQEDLKKSIKATALAEADTNNINSIVKLLALNSPAKIPELENGKEGMALEYLQVEMRELRKLIKSSIVQGQRNKGNPSIFTKEYDRISNALKDLTDIRSSMMITEGERHTRLHALLKETEELMMICDKPDHRYVARLMERIHTAFSEPT